MFVLQPPPLDSLRHRRPAPGALPVTVDEAPVADPYRGKTPR